MKLAGVQYTFGREASTTHNETCGGRLPAAAVGWPFGHTAQLAADISPFVDSSNSSLIAGITDKFVPMGAANTKIGSFDWRITLTDVEANMLPIPAPESYDPARMELLRRYIRAYNASGQKLPFDLPPMSLPNRKSDWKMGGTFGEYAGLQWEYPNATWQRQLEIVAEHRRCYTS